MTLHEGFFTRDTGETSELAQLHSFTTALLLGESVRVNEAVLIEYKTRKRHKNRFAVNKKERILNISRPASEYMTFRKSKMDLQDLVADPLNPDEPKSEFFVTTERKRPTYQIGQSYRLDMFEVVTPEGTALILTVQALVPMTTLITKKDLNSQIPQK